MTLALRYNLRRYRRSQVLRMRVRSDGTVHVTAPLRVSLRVIEAFVHDKQPWIEQMLGKFAANPEKRVGEGTPAEYRSTKRTALALVNERLRYFNTLYHFTVGTVAIRNQRSRWGSCNRRGNLNFNYRIALLPPELQDYLVVHELCHIGEFNHSAAFWSLVARTQPNYKLLRAKIRRLGL